MKTRLVTALMVVAIVCAACSSGGGNETAGGTTPSTTGSSAATNMSSGVTHNPRAKLIVRWTPNVNWKHTAAKVTQATNALGRKLVRDILAARKVPKGARYPCPADLGVDAKFRVGGAHGVADLAGCHWTRFRHRSYWIDDAITKDLRALAPHRWRAYLQTTPAPKLSVAWTPNLNWKHARTKITHGTNAQGRKLLRDIRAAHQVKHPGVYNCPIDFGVTAKFWFAGKHGRADLGGCRFITLRHTTYRSDAAIVKDLRALAPARWKQYLK